ncbi:enoyl-CoA hydratase/isomerase family protein [Aeropyrum pernix]|uniref:Enoyl-CoA hydratase/isomerase family protein n=1 Tax=Aeropyrum pernix TaxID=56636 RepID=A0A401HA17_AERPX|nr:enoyl-CoA hydratase/isomerase family protein [Aeropyrum pernix]
MWVVEAGDSVLAGNYSFVKTRVDPPLGWLVFSRPERLNAFNTSMMREVLAALDELEGDEGVRFVAITGEGKAFSAGIDLGELAEAGSPEEAERLFSTLAMVVERILGLRKPVIMAVNGHAIGGGAELLWAGDIVVAVRSARISWPESLWNLAPPFLPTLGPFVLGPARAAYLALTAEPITAEEAYRMGLVSLLVDEPGQLEDAVKRVAEKIMASPPAAVESIVGMLRAGKRGWHTQLGVAELKRLSKDTTALQAAKSFRDTKRPPDYKSLWRTGKK